MQGAEHFDIKTRKLLHAGLGLVAVLADDVGVVAAGIIEVNALEVTLVRVDAGVHRTEGAEDIRGEERACRLVIAHEDLRPVHHRRHVMHKLMMPGVQDIAVFHDLLFVFHGRDIKLVQELEGLCVADEDHLREHVQDVLDLRAVVRLHVMQHEVIQLSAV